VATSVPAEVERNAPVVWLHPHEAYPPLDPEDWLKAAKLCWYERGKKVVETAAAGVFATAATVEAFAHDEHRLRDLTRAWELTGRAESLGEDSGFALTVGPEPEATFDKPSGTVPIFYEHVEGQYVTYWLFYGWSTVPAKIPGPPRAGFESLSAEDVALQNEAAAALREAFPELVDAATPAFGPESIHPADVLTFVRAWLGSKWPVLHEGDWEGIAVDLNPRHDARPVAYFQHGAPQTRVLPTRRRPTVYVGLGSHASYPDLGWHSPGSPRVKALEELGKGRAVETELVDVRSRPWYGFGGAWGAPGRISDETGPLGPGERKGPRPFAAPGL
jgi:hypothetical protein